MTDLVIETEQLTKAFNNEYAVRDVTMSIEPGIIVGFIGPSGSGKTTTVRLLTGIYQPSTGSAIVLGQRPAHFSRKTRGKIGYMPQLFALYPELSVWENLHFAASIYGLPFSRETRFNELLEFVDLSRHKRKLARNLSGGMKRRLSLAATLVHQPTLIFLDEPTAGIDPVLRRRFWDHFGQLKANGQTVFITTQYVNEASYCDLVGVMINGRLLNNQLYTPKTLRRSAFGGEVVDLVTGEPIRFAMLKELQTQPFVNGPVERIDSSHSARLIVKDASKAIPPLIEWCRRHNLPVESIEEYLPPFDDVFVELIEKEAANEA